MAIRKLFKIPKQVTPKNFEKVMGQAITLELATIPTYLSTYYSIHRTPDEDTVRQKIAAENPKMSSALIQELTLDVIVYANKTAALIMSVLIEEMLHLALASNVKQAICGKSPDLLGIASSKGFIFPTHLDGHKPEFEINLGPLSLKQLVTFLKIESPNAFSEGTAPKKDGSVEYATIGKFYAQIMDCIKENYPGPYKLGKRLQLTGKPKMGIYSSNSINTVYYDRDHNPQFTNADLEPEKPASAPAHNMGLITVVDAATALEALDEIVEQGEGSSGEDHDTLQFDAKGMPKPLPIVIKDGVATVQFKDGDYDDANKEELAHFDKFMEAYSLGSYYDKKFKGYGLDFFSLFVYNQEESPTQKGYEKVTKASVAPSAVKWYPTSTPQKALTTLSNMGNAIFTYILLMIETCYKTESEKEQFQIFMYGVHKSMIWLLSQFGRDLTELLYEKDGHTYNGALTFEYYDFSQSEKRPKAQLIDLAGKAAGAWCSKEKWMIDGDYPNYLQALPDIDLNFDVKDIDKDLGIPKGAYTHK